MKILTLGNGFIASHLTYPKYTKRIDMEKIVESINDILTSKPEVIVNCIGKTGSPNIDWAETHQQITYQTNTLFPILLAHECNKRSIHLIHLGSGCVNYGPSPHYTRDLNNIDAPKIDTGWRETDAVPTPLSFYSKTKLACDEAIKILDGITILRLRMPISSQTSPRNFISKIRGYQQLINIPNSVTFVDDLVKVIDWAATNHKTGLYNVVNSEPLTAVDTMSEFQKYYPTHQFNIITEKQLGQLTKAPRSNCIIDGTKLRQAGFYMTNSKEALAHTMKEYVANLQKEQWK